MASKERRIPLINLRGEGMPHVHASPDGQITIDDWQNMVTGGTRRLQVYASSMTSRSPGGINGAADANDPEKGDYLSFDAEVRAGEFSGRTNFWISRRGVENFVEDWTNLTPGSLGPRQ